ncbi:MAG: Ada metal-binding domain-containing protein [Patescibacteria group bacterium]
MIPQYYSKIKAWIIENQSDVYIAAVIFLVGLLSFGLGRLSVLWPEKEPITFENAPSSVSRASSTIAGSGNTIGGRGNSGAAGTALLRADGRYVASKSGSAYHFPWCPGALKIREDNKIWFDTAADAEQKGYRPAKNCPGME